MHSNALCRAVQLSRCYFLPAGSTYTDTHCFVQRNINSLLSAALPYSSMHFTLFQNRKCKTLNWLEKAFIQNLNCLDLLDSHCVKNFTQSKVLKQLISSWYSKCVHTKLQSNLRIGKRKRKIHCTIAKGFPESKLS